jgi:acetyl esterase
MTIAPDAQHVLDIIRMTGRAPFETLSPAEARAIYLAGRNVLQPDPPAVATIRDLSAPGPAGIIPLRLYRAAGSDDGARLPALIFYHGGGWVIGDLDSHDIVCRALANASGGCVIAVDYRLAPEHKFPAAVEDCAAATAWIIDHAAELRIDGTKIAIGGDSAGGNLAAVLAIMARDGAFPPPCLQVLIYPATDMTGTHASYARITEGFPLTATTVRWFAGHYLATPADALDWRASPLRAADLSRLAPAFVLTAAYDPLCDEGQDYARRLEREGNRVLAIHVSDQIHGYLTMGRVIAGSATLIALAAAALREAWRAATRFHTGQAVRLQ